MKKKITIGSRGSKLALLYAQKVKEKIIEATNFTDQDINIEKISTIKKFEIGKKYQFLDDIFLRVLNKHPEKMSNIFFNMFKASPKTVIKFLSNKSNFIEDLSVIMKMPKWTFIKALFY